MSILTDKHILVVGDETSQIHNIESLVQAEGMHVHTTTCEMVSLEQIEHDSISIVLLNHLHEGNACIEMLTQLRKRRVHKILPIIAVVENDQAKIEEALTLGAADYITSDEPLESVVQKMKVILGEPDNFADAGLVDLNHAHTEQHSGRVYVVEDDPLLRNLLSLRLQKTGFTFTIDVGIGDVLPGIREFKPDVLVLDLMLPNQSGFDVLEAVRLDEELKQLPVIVFSNRDSQEDRAHAMKLGVNGYYIKAMTDLAELMATIDGVIEKHD